MKEKVFLALVGAIFIGIGLFHLALPGRAISVFEIDLTAISSINEIRANYGGMHFLLGLFFVSGAKKQRFENAALLVVTVFTGGLVLGRVVSLVVDGSPNAAVWAFLALEAVGCLVAFLLLSASRPLDKRGV